LAMVFTGTAVGAITTESLLNDMTDLQRLASLPTPAYTTRQFSSYNRQSKTPDDTEGWFANRDRGQYLREEKAGDRTEYVMMDAEGPGAIVRIWSANPEGTLRIYLDGATEPVLTAPMADLLGGKVAGLPEPIAGMRSRGWNLYFPIPYSKHCKVTSDKGNFYYQVNYRTYAPGTQAKSFEQADLQRLAPRIQQIAKQLEGRRDEPADEGKKVLLSGQVNAGKEISVNVDGPKAISWLHVQFPGVFPQDEPAMARGLVLKMSFDGENTVECPLGDFFGTAPGLSRYHSLPLKIFGEGKSFAESAWFMPFARQARISIVNLTNTAYAVHATLSVVPCEWTDRSLLFHAKWRIERDLPSRPHSDWTHLECKGNGRFVGGSLNVVNPVRGWWGEGDEKIWVDDDRFPSLFGTGSEDYFNYSWSAPDLFWLPYCGQPRNDGPGNRGFVTNYRWHVADALPFDRSIAFYLELFSHERLPGFSYARIGYHYGRPGIIDDQLAIKPADVRELRLPEAWEPAARGGASRAVFHQAETLVRGARLPLEAGRLYAGGQLPVWRPARPGETLHLRVPVDSAGQYRIRFVARLDGDGGRVRLQWDGAAAALASGDSTVDLRVAGRTILRDFYLRPMRLTAGPHDLALVFDGAAPEVARPAIGIDFVWVQGVR